LSEIYGVDAVDRAIQDGIAFHAYSCEYTRAATHGSLALPHDERPFNPSRETKRILAKAKAIGPATDQLCQSLFDSEGAWVSASCGALSVSSNAIRVG
jgi:hypothetical protein